MQRAAVCVSFGRVNTNHAKLRLRDASYAASPALAVQEAIPVAEAWLVVKPAGRGTGT